MSAIPTVPWPLVPPYVDLTSFPTMPLDVRKLRDSKFASTAGGEAFRCAVLLWAAAWHQVPASSLPDDDNELAQLAGFGRSTKEWLKQRKAGALHGFVRCAEDGKLYHRTIAEKAIESWNRKAVRLSELAADRARKQNKKRAETGLDPLPIPEPLPELIYCENGFPTEYVPDAAGFPPEKALKGTEQNGTDRSFKRPSGDPSTGEITPYPDTATDRHDRGATVGGDTSSLDSAIVPFSGRSASRGGA